MDKCCAIIVTFKPDMGLFKKVLSAVSTQVEVVYVIDNASRLSFDDIKSNSKIICTILEKNHGIAAGFNAGIQIARREGFKYALLLDQDSIAPENMVNRFHEAISALQNSGEPVAAVGPRYRSHETGHTSKFVRFGWLHNRYVSGDDHTHVIKTDFLISSGSFFDLSVFDKVGLFDEGLFIDHVDTEWAHRANNLGFQFFGVWDVIMPHSIGEGAVRLWLFRWRVQPMHKPFRLYYVARNSLLMYRMSHVPLKWICGDIVRLCRIFHIYMIFSPHWRQALRFFLLGLRDGIRGVRGPSPY